ACDFARPEQKQSGNKQDLKANILYEWGDAADRAPDSQSHSSRQEKDSDAPKPQNIRLRGRRGHHVGGRTKKDHLGLGNKSYEATDIYHGGHQAVFRPLMRPHINAYVMNI